MLLTDCVYYQLPITTVLKYKLKIASCIILMCFASLILGICIVLLIDIVNGWQTYPFFHRH